MAEEISAISAIRKEKLINLRRSGIEPYPNNFPDRIDTACALDKKEGETVRVAGRLMSMRVMGKSIFAHLTDSTGTIQIYIRKDTPNNEKNPGNVDFENFKNLDVGDFVGVEGKIFVTRTGEKTVLIDDYVLLCKSLLSLPEKWHKLKDTELKYRKRYLDILVNEESSKILKARTSIISSIRDHLSEKGFIEVETPILQDIPGGAAARPFVTHHNTFDIGLYLRIAPELYLKRLLVGGWDKVFEIGRNFRNEGTSTRHNPEFTMLEVYSAYTDYRYMMGLTKEIIQDAAKSIANFGFSSLNFDGEWREENMWELLTKYTKTDFLPDDSYEELKIKADKLDVPQGVDSHEKLIDRIFSKYVQPNLIQPTIVTGYLAEYSPLAKKSPSNDKIAERFEIFIGGYEIGNAYSEQNDPELQREMFKLKLNESEDQKEIDEDYIQALEYGMPPASGLGIGIDRLVMLLTGSESIREVILFPMLKPLEKLKVKS